MRRIIAQLFKSIALLTLMLPFTNVKAGVEDFEISFQNLTQTESNKLEFDVYLLDTDAGQPFVLGSCQLGFLINSLISTGSLTVTYDNSTSGLNSSQVFTATPTTVVGPSGYPDQTLVRIGSRFIPEAAAGATIQTVAPGTLLTHIIITSSVDFVGNSTPDISFNSVATTPTLYPTRVGEFISDLLTQLTVTPGVNAIVYGNPILNPPPSSFSVTGGGSYCQGSGGLPVGLADSESGVTYTLYKDGTPQVPTVSGTDSPITFGNQLAGTYTVSGSNAGGTTAMTGEVVIEELLLPAAPVTGTITQPTCTTETGSVVLTGLSSESWTINPGNITGNTTSTTISDLSASIYVFTVTVFGCTSAPGGEVVINAQPETPPKPVITLVDDYLESSSNTGNQWYNSSGIIIDATEQIYIPSENDNFYVIVTNTDGCASEASEIISFATGVEKNDLFEGIVIYPNPAMDYLNIQNNSMLNSVGFEIMNSNGKIIYNSILNTSIIIDISQFSPGIYCIRFRKGNLYPVFKFIKQ